jgi:uncharacterized protein with PIN domain
MISTVIRFYGNLNDFLKPSLRNQAFAHTSKEARSVKDLIESLGVPHTEVDALLVDGKPVDFSFLLHGGETISVYPFPADSDILSESLVRPAPLEEIRFILDVHLGKLASYLRILGFDALYSNDAEDEQLAIIASEQKRILLTYDRELLKRSIVVYGYYVRSRKPAMQLTEVLKRFGLGSHIRPFQRCLRCNTLLQEAAKEDILSQIPECVRDSQHEFYRCPACGRIYWKGTHYENMQGLIQCVEKSLE